MDPQEVVIVDASGTEHHFPSGFDPKRAAGIVRGQSAPPAERTGGETALEVAKGVGKGALHSGIDLASMAAMSGMLPGLSSTSLPSQVTDRARELTPYRNDPQKVGGALETAAELYSPAKALVRGVPAMARAIGPTALNLAEHLPVVGKPLRLLRGASSLLPKAAAEAAPAAAQTGGRLVGAKAAPPIEQEMADAIAEVRQATPSPRLTTPPEPQLPAGYTPRATATPKRAYFLKTADVAPTAPAKGPVGMNDLPESWKAMTAPPEKIAPRNIGGSELAGAYSQELIRRGVKPAAAMKAVRGNPDLPPDVKTQILNALIKARKGTS